VVASQKPTEKTLGDLRQFHHEGTVSFTAEFQVPAGTGQGSVVVKGKLGFQTCDERGICKKPTVADFQFAVNVTTEADPTAGEVIFKSSESNYEALVEIASRTQEGTGQAAELAKEPFNLSNFLWYCGLSFLAGLILNVMPCVLPVIGLKMMSFVEQSGENRGRIFALNISFSLGLITVFWFLAFMVIVLNFGWGEMLNNLLGVIIASGIVFAFGLSMIGVWEIPIPGFASSGAASQLAEKEGLGGAYIKGILTTILATPCVGPMLIPAMTFAVTQTQIVAFALFTVLGLGMASPFILVAFFPGAIKLLPKPGAWMETFKQLMGFILIATVSFLMNTFSQKGDQVAWLMSVLTMLLAIGVGCWWIGRTSIAAEFGDKLKAYTLGLAIIGGGSFLGFYYLGPREFELDWKMYSDQRLVESKNSGSPIFIDFTGPG
ncbi:MAG: cytochrome c biogenesis protein CcdA, partial [Planctomycetota bacterium]|nr:cytochrome c biogenesis protein CcdA [Planctomycetota bacterium]